MTQETNIPIAIRVIALDETDYFNFPSHLAPFVKEIHGVYFYDKNQHVYLCEITPSYALEFLYHNVIFVYGEFGADDNKDADIRAKIDELVCEAYHNGNPEYMHVNTVDYVLKGFQDSNARFRFHVEQDEMLPDDMNYDEYMEEMREELNANHVI